MSCCDSISRKPFARNARNSIASSNGMMRFRGELRMMVTKLRQTGNKMRATSTCRTSAAERAMTKVGPKRVRAVGRARREQLPAQEQTLVLTGGVFGCSEAEEMARVNPQRCDSTCRRMTSRNTHG